MNIKNTILGGVFALAALSSVCFGQAETIVINSSNMGNFLKPSEAFKVAPKTSVTISGDVKFKGDIGNADAKTRYLYMNAGRVKIEKGAELEFSEAYPDANTAQTIMGETEVEGNLTFRNRTGKFGNWTLFSNWNYTFDGVRYPEGVFSIKNGGRVNAYIGGDVVLGRARIYGSGKSELRIGSGGTLCVQAVILMQSGIFTLEKNSNYWGAISGDFSPYTIVESNPGKRSVMNIDDGVRIVKNGILLRDKSNFDIRLAKNKEKNVSIEWIKSYSTKYSSIPNVRIFNFRNNYVLIRDDKSISAEGGQIKLGGFMRFAPSKIVLSAHSEDAPEGFSDGWYLEPAYDGKGKFIGSYLNNKNFPKAKEYVAPVVKNFEIIPMFDNTTVKSGEPFKFKFKNFPKGASYILTSNQNRKTISAGELKEEMEFTIDGAQQAELKCLGVFDETSQEYAKKLNIFAFMVSPEDIKVVNERPADFDEYWNARKAEIDPIPPILELKLVSEKDGVTTYMYKVKCDNFDFYNTDADFSEDETCFYGIVSSGYLSFPTAKAGEELPIVFTVYGAGTFQANSRDPIYFAKLGYLSFSMNPHPISQEDVMSSDASIKGKAKARQKMIKSGRYFRDRNVAEKGKSNIYDPKLVYFNGIFKRLYQGLRAASEMRSANGEKLPKWDGKNFAMRGISMGGAQSVAGAYLFPKVSLITPIVPALGDIAGRSTGRYSGWPYWVDPANLDRINFTRYFDVALMAQSVKAKALVVMGLIDTTCSPHAVSAIRNSLKGESAPYYMQRTGHSPSKQGMAAANSFIIKNIPVNN